MTVWVGLCPGLEGYKWERAEPSFSSLRAFRDFPLLLSSSPNQFPSPVREFPHFPDV